MGATTKLFDLEDGTGTSEVLHTARYGTKKGIYHIYWPNRPTGTFNVELQVSPNGEDTWTSMIFTDDRDPNRFSKTYAEIVFHYPFTRVVITANTGAQLSIWYIE